MLLSLQMLRYVLPEKPKPIVETAGVHGTPRSLELGNRGNLLILTKPDIQPIGKSHPLTYQEPTIRTLHAYNDGLKRCVVSNLLNLS